MVTALVVLFLALVGVGVFDLLQRQNPVWRNFPVVGHLRNVLQRFGPELRQYFFSSDTEERPFDRIQRTWVHRTAEDANSYQGFGTAAAIETTPNYLIIRHSSTPLDPPPQPDLDDGQSPAPLPAGKVLGAARGRRAAVRPPSLVNVGAMSFGSLSSAATIAINAGCRDGDAWQNTGEGGIAPHHLHGGELIWQIGTGYFGCRTSGGHLDLDQLVDKCAEHPVRAIEIKLSQGAKPGLGGVLPAAKITPEIAQIRGIPTGIDCISPATHSAFAGVDGLLDLVEEIADRTGLPVGIKSAVGQLDFFEDLAEAMADDPGRGVDFIAIDGGEGGTGAAPVVFADHVALPFFNAFPRVYRTFAERGVAERVFWMGAGKLGFPDRALLALGLGADGIYVAREAMLSIGCIQAQKCHTGHCPVGVATQNPRLVRGLVPEAKSVKLASYLQHLRSEIHRLARACGVPHPALISTEHFEFLEDGFRSRSATDVFDYQPAWGAFSGEDLDEAMLA